MGLVESCLGLDLVVGLNTGQTELLGHGSGVVSLQMLELRLKLFSFTFRDFSFLVESRLAVDSAQWRT